MQSDVAGCAIIEGVRTAVITASGCVAGCWCGVLEAVTAVVLIGLGARVAIESR